MKPQHVALFSLVGCAGTEPTTDVTWYEDIEPMVNTYCVRCHQDGGSGIGDFTRQEIFSALAEVALGRIDAGEMPPPAADPDCRDYKASERMWLPDEQRDLLATWIQGGKPLGDERNRVEVDLIEPTLEDADLELTLEFPYTPTYSDPDNPANEYRCFYLDHGQSEDFYITAMHPIIDQSSILHHVVVGLVDADDVPSSYDPTVGADCIDNSAATDGMLSAWAPGMVPIEFENGEGLRVGKNDRIILQLHYFQNGPDAVGLTDQSGYAFKTASSVTKQILMVPVGTYDFEIPADDPNHVHTDSTLLNYGLDLEVYGTFPHMHNLGKRLRSWAEEPDGTEACIVEGDFDFDNQLTYMFKEPMRIENGSTVHLECTWDNSSDNPDNPNSPPVTTYYGERTDEEMCFAFTFVGIAN